MALSKKTQPSVTPQLISAPRIPDVYGIPYTSVRDLVFRGELPVVKLGRAWYFKRADIDAFLERRTERLSVA